MSANDDLIQKNDEILRKLQSYGPAYQDLQQAMPYINSGVEQLKFTKTVLESPFGSSPGVRSLITEALGAWDTLPTMASFGGQGATGPYGVGTSACSGLVAQVYQFGQEYKQQAKAASELSQVYNGIAQAEARVSRLTEILNVRDAALSINFQESVKYYNAWKGNPTDIRAFATAMRNMLESLKGHLNNIKNEILGVPPRDDFSWPKMVDVIGKSNKRELLLEKTVHEKMHSNLSEYLKGIVVPSSQEIERTYSEYVDHVDSMVHLLDPEIKRRFFGIQI